MAAKKKIDAKFLKGLKFRTSEMRKVKDDGRDKMKGFPVERDLTPEDVLDWKDNGESVSIVTADGQKYNVPKKEEK